MMMSSKLAAGFSAAAFLFAACGGSDSDNSPIVPTGDVLCEPQAQTGCEAGEKCTSVVVSVNDPATPAVDEFKTETRCVPEGTVAPGAACEFGDPGEDTGFDDCMVGYYCSGGAGGVCTEICEKTNNGTTCTGAGAENCVTLAGIFEETDLSAVGVCAQACDPVVQDCEVAGDACYLNPGSAEASCAVVPGSAADLDQDDPCAASAAGNCFLNGCSKGYAALLPLPPSDTASQCAGFCNPVETHTAQTGSAGGDGAAIHCGTAFGDATRSDNPDIAGDNAGDNYQCRFIQRMYYPSGQNVDVTHGICVPVSLWGDCDACDITNLDTYLATCNDIGTIGCINVVTLEGLLSQATATSFSPNALYEEFERRGIQAGVRVLDR